MPLDQLTAALHRVARFEPGGGPVVSAHLDLRPHAVGDPTVRAGEVVLRSRATDLTRDTREHSPDGASLRLDLERVRAAVADAAPDVHGLAVFACGAADLFEAIPLPVAVGSEVSAGAYPDLVPLARLADQEAALVALYDTNTLRLFVLRAGALLESGGVDEPPDEFGRHLAMRGVLGGRVDERRADFARDAAQAIERAIDVHDPAWLLLAADEVALPILQDKLSKRAQGILRGVIRADIRASWDDVLALAGPVVERLHREDAHDAADTLAAEVGEQDLGVYGIEPVRDALERGQVLALMVDEGTDLAREVLGELVRMAASTDARVRFIEGHDALRAAGGIGALLRFRLDQPDEAVVASASRS